MSQKSTSGPCGLSFDEIIAMAGRLGSQAATFGLTDPEYLNEFCLALGKKLTPEFILVEADCDLESYEHRLARVAKSFIETIIQTDSWRDCTDLGPYSSPLTDEVPLRAAAQAFLDCFYMMRKKPGISAPEILDLLAWLQCTLGLRMICTKFPQAAPMTALLHT